MVARFLLYVGVMLLVGGTGVRQALWPVRLRWLGLGFFLLLAGATLNVWLTLAPLDALNPGDLSHFLLDIPAGRAALWTLLGAALLLASELSRVSRLASLGAATLTLWGLVGIGHGVAHGVPVRLLHLLHAGAMTLWTAGVLFLWNGTAEQARRFSPLALGCVLTLAVTGLLLTLQHAGNLLALPHSEYGRTLLLKVGVYSLTPGTALLVRRAFFRGGRVQVAVGAELLLLLGLLALTANLTGLEPPTHMGATPIGMGHP